MPKIDLLGYKIRVILNSSGLDTYCSSNVPKDVEGTVIELTYDGIHTIELVAEGKILEALILSDSEALVRWDNDRKIRIPGSSLSIRNSKIGFCESIWSSDHIYIPFDERPFNELKPKTSFRRPKIPQYYTSNWVTTLPTELVVDQLGKNEWLTGNLDEGPEFVEEPNEDDSIKVNLMSTSSVSTNIKFNDISTNYYYFDSNN